MNKSPSLSSVLHQMNLALFLGIALLAGALLYFSGALRFALSHMLLSVDSVYYAEELRDHLRSLALAPTSEDERRITRLILRDLQAGAGSPVEQEMIDELGLLLSSFEAGSIEGLHRAQAITANLIALNREQAQALHREVERYDRRSNIVAIGALALAVSLSLVIRRRLQVLVLAPLGELTDGLRRFSKGREVPPGKSRFVAEIGEVREALAQLAETIERQRRLQLEFVASVAHDVRNPIANLSTAIRQLRPGSTLGEKHANQIFEIAERQIDHLNHLIGDLLDRSRIESGKFSLRAEKHELASIVEDAVSWHEGSSDRHDIEIRIAERPLWIECDRDRLIQVMNNLVSNAIKYSPAGGRIGVSLSAADGGAIIAVEDDGIGVPPEDMEKIFDPFSRSTRSRDSIPGVGLGLSVVRKIVEAHGGRVRVVARTGGGSRFEVELPLIEA